MGVILDSSEIIALESNRGALQIWWLAVKMSHLVSAW